MRAALIAIALGATGCSELVAPAAPGEAPAGFRGVWGADCDRPFMQLEARRIRVFADGAAYDLTATALSGDSLTLRYRTPRGEIEESLLRTDGDLRLVRGTYAATAGKPGVTVTWNKAPMKRCPASAAPTV